MVTKSTIKKLTLLVFSFLIIQISMSQMVFAEETVIPSISVEFGQGTDNVASSIQILLLITILSLAPSILIMMTSFTRFIIVFSFVRRAISMQSTPPNQVLIALALFMTFFVMSPVITEIVDTAYTPYVNQEISTEEALDAASIPIKTYMLKNTRTEDIKLFKDLSGSRGETVEEVPITTIIPAFIISELRAGFEIGFLLFIPFIVIDMVVASTLMSLGMMMLPPVMISLPFKVLLFIMVDGWHLIVERVIRSVNI